ncbi:Protein of unknown function [Gryllus bimaculatus]|nr:Protein of unknown function [Gryllus bimaculatus]
MIGTAVTAPNSQDTFKRATAEKGGMAFCSNKTKCDHMPVAKTMAILAEQGFVLPNLPYMLDLVPNNYALFNALRAPPGKEVDHQ